MHVVMDRRVAAAFAVAVAVLVSTAGASLTCKEAEAQIVTAMDVLQSKQCQSAERTLTESTARHVKSRQTTTATPPKQRKSKAKQSKATQNPFCNQRKLEGLLTKYADLHEGMYVEGCYRPPTGKKTKRGQVKYGPLQCKIWCGQNLRDAGSSANYFFTECGKKKRSEA